MTSFGSNPASEPAKVEQVITEFFAKSLHIILESRSPYVSSRNFCTELFASSPSPSSSSSSGQPRDKWFNLALRDCPAALENFDLWRQSNLEPLVVDVILICRRLEDEVLPEIKSERIVERWVVQYENRRSSNSPREPYLSGRRRGAGGVGSSHSSEIPSMYKKMYRRTVILLRSLYATVRLLPAYKVFRDLNSSGRIFPFSLSHKISSFVEPFTRAEDAEMTLFSFVPIETPCGRLSLTVSYLPTLEDVSSEPSTPISTQFIPDYVGSPNTDPIKRLHSLPSGGSLPAYVSFTRRHSWSNDQGVAPSVSPSPSPTYSDSRALHYPQDQSPSTCPSSHNLSSLGHTKDTCFGEYWPSPPFSLSSSPSPPTHLPRMQLQSSIVRSESAPLSIPLPRHEKIRGAPFPGLPPSSPVKSGKAGRSYQTDLLRTQVITASASQTSSPESRVQQKKGSGEFHIGMSLQKILYSGKDEVGNLSGRKLSSCSSPHIPLRSSSKMSFPDEFDDSEFTCPFVEDDEDIGSSSRVGPTDADIHAGENLAAGELIPIRRSPDAVVGALVRMLKTAAPLRQDLPVSVLSSQTLKDKVFSQSKGMEDDMQRICTASGSMITASGLARSRTASDALEELKKYKEMKESLLREGGSQSLDVDRGEKSASGSVAGL